LSFILTWLDLGFDLLNIHVDIEAKPTWKIKPSDVHVGEGENVELVCESDFVRPSVTVQWFINGVPMSDARLRRNPRRRISRNRLIIQNVSQSDTAVYQCNVSNRHGSLFANAFVNVICE
jgi:hypothetical protein